jgi:hypothetical protein
VELFRARMKTVKDVWCFEYGYPLAWEEIILKFPLIPEDRPFWRHLTSSFPRDWSCKLRIGLLPVKKKEWVGLYASENVALPMVVLKVPSNALQITEDTWLSLPMPMDTTFFSVGAQSCTLHRDDLITGLMMPGSDEHSFSAPDPRSLQVPS